MKPSAEKIPRSTAGEENRGDATGLIEKVSAQKTQERQASEEDLADWESADTSKSEESDFWGATQEKWSFDQDDGRAVLEYFLDKAQLPPERARQIREELGAKSAEEGLELIESQMVTVHPSEQSIQREVEERRKNEEISTLGVINEHIDATHKEYNELLELLRGYRPDLQFPTYHEAVEESERAIEKIGLKNFGLEEDYEDETGSPFVVALWDRYQGLVQDGRLYDQVYKETLDRVMRELRGE